jgi:hypothetical protein
MNIIRSTQKCEHCGNWTDGNKAFCQFCGEILDVRFRHERTELEQKLKNLPGFMEFIKIKGSDKNLIFWGIEKMLQTGQFIITIIVALVTLILLALPG